MPNTMLGFLVKAPKAAIGLSIIQLIMLASLHLKNHMKMPSWG